MPVPGRVPTLGQAPGIRSDPGPRILELRDLAPLVPGAHEGVTDRAPGRREVAGERKGLQQQAVADRRVEIVEFSGIVHGPSTVRGAPTMRKPVPRRVQPSSDAGQGEDGREMTATLSPPRATGSPTRPRPLALLATGAGRSEEHTSELQSLMRISYAVFCLKKKKSKQ